MASPSCRTPGIMIRMNPVLVLGMVGFPWVAAAVELRDIPPDLTVTAAEEGKPAPGRLVRQVLDEHADGGVRHLLYLPGASC